MESDRRRIRRMITARPPSVGAPRTGRRLVGRAAAGVALVLLEAAFAILVWVFQSGWVAWWVATGIASGSILTVLAVAASVVVRQGGTPRRLRVVAQVLGVLVALRTLVVGAWAFLAGHPDLGVIVVVDGVLVLWPTAGLAADLRRHR